MKIIETFFLFNIATAQGNSIEGRILKVEEKCGLFMDKALICVPPEVKKSKYIHRLNKVMRDAKWHKVSYQLKMDRKLIFDPFQSYSRLITRDTV